MAILITYTSVVPSIASNIIDNVRKCPIYLSEDLAANETLVNMLKEVIIEFLTLMMLFTTAADDTLIFFLFFRENKASQEMSSNIYFVK